MSVSPLVASDWFMCATNSARVLQLKLSGGEQELTSSAAEEGLPDEAAVFSARVVLCVFETSGSVFSAGTSAACTSEERLDGDMLSAETEDCSDGTLFTAEGVSSFLHAVNMRIIIIIAMTAETSFFIITPF